MPEKVFPLSQDKLEEIIRRYPTPFHIYDVQSVLLGAVVPRTFRS